MELTFEQWQERAERLMYGALRNAVGSMNYLPECGMLFKQAKIELLNKSANHRRIMELGYAEWKVACQNLEASEDLLGDRFKLEVIDGLDGLKAFLLDKKDGSTVKAFNVLECGTATSGNRAWSDVFSAARAVIGQYLKDEQACNRLAQSYLQRVAAI